MKNAIRITSALIIVIVLTISLTSCGSPKDKITGEWELKSGSLMLEALWSDLHIENSGIPEEPIFLRLFEDNSFSLKYSGIHEPIGSGTYSVPEKGVINFYYDYFDNVYRYKVQGNSLTITNGEYESQFKKPRSDEAVFVGVVSALVGVLITGGILADLNFFLNRKNKKDQLEAVKTDGVIDGNEFTGGVFSGGDSHDDNSQLHESPEKPYDYDEFMKKLDSLTKDGGKKHCPVCKAEVGEGNSFCGKCGTKVK